MGRQEGAGDVRDCGQSESAGWRVFWFYAYEMRPSKLGGEGLLSESAPISGLAAAIGRQGGADDVRDCGQSESAGWACVLNLCICRASWQPGR